MTSCVCTELLLISFSWSPSTCMSVRRGPQENIAYEFILISPAVFWVSCLSYLNGLEMGGRWPYSCCFVGCCFQNLFNIAHSILVQFPSSFFFIHLVSILVVHPSTRSDMTYFEKKCVLFYRIV